MKFDIEKTIKNQYIVICHAPEKYFSFQYRKFNKSEF